MRHFFRIADRLGHRHQFFARSFSCLFNTATNRSRIATRYDVAEAFLENCSSQNGCCCGAVTSQVAGLLSYFNNQLCAHVFKAIFQLNFFGHGNTVFGNRWTAEAFVDDHVATGWPHGDRDCVGQFLHTLQHPGAGMIFKQ